MNPTIRDRIKALRRVRAGDLVPSPKNWRTHPQVQRDALNGVLAQVGYADAILVREVNGGVLEIIDGHLRVEEADPDQELPVLVLDVSEEEASLILATHDPLGAMAYPDLDLYLPLIEDLNPDSEAVAALLEAVANNEARPLYEPLVPDPGGLTDPDHLPVVDEKDAVVKLGQVWALGDHRLMCGDATNPEHHRILLEDVMIDLVLTDPPYGVGTSYLDYEDTPEHLKELIDEVMPLLLKWPRSLMAVGWRHMWLYPQAGWMLAWVEPAGNGVGPWGFNCWHPILAYGSDPYLANRLGSRPDTFVGTGEHASSDQHPVAKPMIVWEWFMERGSIKKGESVFDPFVGSGTTIIAAEKTGRICYAMDIEPRYCDVAIRRWEEYTGKTAVLVEEQC